MKNMKKIGILGGTFNPVHMGHLCMAEYARDAVKLDKILFIPTGTSYMKNKAEILPGQLRKKMLDLCIRENKFFETSDIELRREGNTYTYETLLELTKMYPNAELYFIVGADCLFSIENWVEPQQIFEHCILIAANRNHMEKNAMEQKKLDLENKYHANILLLDFPTMDISSSEIRKRIKEGKSIRYMVPDVLWDYLQNEKLYD